MNANGQKLRIEEGLDLERALVVARRFLDDLKKLFPKKSKMQLLPVALHKGGIVAAQMLVEDIERNQAKKLSVADQIYLRNFKDELQRKTECLSH